MITNEIRELFSVPVATSVTLLSVAVSSWLALRQYRLKLKSQKVENDIRLVKAFCDLLNIAHARSQTIYSEKFLEKLVEKDVLSKADFEGLDVDKKRLDLEKKISTAALITPIGSAAQDAAIAAVATLGLRHSVLKEASVQALASLATSIPQKKDVISDHLLAARGSAVKYHLCNVKRWLLGR